MVRALFLSDTLSLRSVRGSFLPLHWEVRPAHDAVLHVHVLGLTCVFISLVTGIILIFCLQCIEKAGSD